MEEKCAICHNMIPEDKRVVTSCNHKFCSECFFKWLKKKPNCPVCRNSFVRIGGLEIEMQQDELNNLIRETEAQYELLDKVKVDQIEQEIKNKLLEADYHEIVKVLNALDKDKGKSITEYNSIVNDVNRLKRTYVTEKANFDNIQTNVNNLRTNYNSLKGAYIKLDQAYNAKRRALDLMANYNREWENARNQRRATTRRFAMNL